NVWCDGRRPDHLYSSRDKKSHYSGPITGVDLRDARHHADRQRCRLFHQWSNPESAFRQCHGNELRNTAHVAGLDHLLRLHRLHLWGFAADYSVTRRRSPNGGSSPPSFRAGPWLVLSFRNWSKSSPRRNQATSRKWSSPRRKAE